MHTQELNEYPDEWKEEYLRLSTWVRDVATRYPGVQVRLIDIQSMVGFWKLLRYRLRRYPAILLPTGERFCGWDALTTAEACIAEYVAVISAEVGYQPPAQPA